jgi:hypothetical protein
MQRIRQTVLVLAIALAANASACGPPGAAASKQVADPVPSRLALAPDVDHFFHFGMNESGEWLWLKRDASYTRVEHDDLGWVWTVDRGAWHVDGSQLMLDAVLRARDIRTRDFEVHFYGACAVGLLPELRRQIVATRAEGKPIDDVKAGFHAPNRRCGAYITETPEPWKGCHAAEPDHPDPSNEAIDALIRAIDAYVATPANRHRFVFEAYAYRGQRFLMPVDPGPDAFTTFPSVLHALDQPDHGPPQGVHLEVSRDVFSSVDACDFPAAHGKCQDVAFAMAETLARWFPGPFGDF